MKKTTRVTLGDQWNEGARLSWCALVRKGWTVTQLRGRMLGRDGVSALASGVVDAALYGDSQPMIWLAVQIKALLGTPLEAWAKPATRDFVLPAARREAKHARTVVPSLGKRKSVTRAHT